MDSASLDLPDNGHDLAARFDAVLYKGLHYGDLDDYNLGIRLRIHLEQINPSPAPWTADSEKKLYTITPWAADDWAHFVAACEAQGNMWNDKFWLAPPLLYSRLDQVDKSKAIVRPYVKCLLDVDWQAAAADAHISIQVANIGMPLNTSGNNFRDDSVLYNAQSTAPVTRNYLDAAGVTYQTVQHTIAHEIGHALGLPHIGVLRYTALCEKAILYSWKGNDIYWEFRGGTNSKVCYGFHGDRAVAQNVMGVGDKFTEDDARPWLRAITALEGPYYGNWRVLTAWPGHNFVVGQEASVLTHRTRE